MRMFGSIVNIKLPDLGEGTKEATIKEILVKVGQRVEEVSLITISNLPDNSMKIYVKCLLTNLWPRFRQLLLELSGQSISKMILSVRLATLLWLSRKMMVLRVASLLPKHPLLRNLWNKLKLQHKNTSFQRWWVLRKRFQHLQQDSLLRVRVSTLIKSPQLVKTAALLKKMSKHTWKVVHLPQLNHNQLLLLAIK